jgi:glycosyltransferase involved in cell wall biosynthesis
MNILMANWTWYPSGGDWTYIDSVCKMYEKQGHHIIPFSVKNEKNFPTPYDRYFLDPVNYKQYYHKKPIISGINTALKSIYSVEAKKKLKLLLNENKVDLVQLNSISNYHTPSIIPVIKKAKIPIVWRILDYRLICPNSTLYVDGQVCTACFNNQFYNCIVNKCKKKSLLASSLLAIENYTYAMFPLHKQVDLFLFQSEFTRDMFVKFGYDKNKTHIIENPYESNQVEPKYKGENYILYFGRIEKEKGIYTLLDAMKLLPDHQLKIVGNGNELDSSIAYASKESIHNVEFLGPKWNKELDPIIRDCEFVIIPSEWHEPSPYVALQSFSFGKPVIASKMGGLNDLIEENVNGLFFKPGNALDLSNKIDSLINNKQLIQTMGENARHILNTKYSPERYYTDTMNVFTDLINTKSNI